MRGCRLKLTVLAVAALLAAGLGAERASAQGAPVKIGSKNFTESIVFGHIIAELLEADGFKVERKFQLGGTGVIHQALVNGDIDVYPEYTGTALTAILKQQAQSDPKAVFDVVKSQYAEKFKLVWQPTFGFNDTYALVMKRQRAAELKLLTYSEPW